MPVRKDAPDSSKPPSKVGGVSSPVTTPEGAIAFVSRTEGPSPRKTKTIGGSAKEPSWPAKGYENLGPATDPRAGKQRIKP